MYNIKNKRKWIQFKPSSNTTVAYIITHLNVLDTFQWLRDQGQKYYRNALGTPQNVETKGRNTPGVRLVSDYAWQWFYINVGRVVRGR